MTSLAAAKQRLGETAPVHRRRHFAGRYRGRYVYIAMLSYLVLLVLLAAFAPSIAPNDPNKQSLLDNFQSPSWDHWLGTDHFGRDVLSRLLFGARVSLGGPMIALIVAVSIGVPAGLVAGYRGGAVDWVISRVADTMLSVPAIVLAIAFVAVFGPSLFNAMAIVGLVYAPYLFRIIRGSTMTLSEDTFVDSARSIGCGEMRILATHILPNVLGLLVAQVILILGHALLAEASLSFLGLGVQPPTASWGSMLRDAYENRYQAPYAVVLPGVAISITVLAFSVVGDGVRRAKARRPT